MGYKGILWVAAGVTAAVTMSIAVPGAFAADLSIGDPAPAIRVSRFVKGAPVTTLGNGKVCVVEFWATWCGPCIQTIPHVTQLAKKYPAVQFVGVSVWESDQSQVVPFVTRMGSKMNYSVAMDRVAPGAGGNSGAMAKTWMTAAGQSGIPTAFIVGKDGRIAWIGHPMSMAEPLAMVTAGTWNTTAAAAKFKQEQAVNAAIRNLSRDMGQTRDPKKVLASLNRAFASAPALESRLGPLKFSALMKVGGVDANSALSYGNRLIDTVYRSDAQSLNSFAWGIVDPAARQKMTPKIAQLGLKAALKADTVSLHKDPAITDTLAAAYYATGNKSAALKTQLRAMSLAKGTQFEKDPALAMNLKRYQTAVAEAGR